MTISAINTRHPEQSGAPSGLVVCDCSFWVCMFTDLCLCFVLRAQYGEGINFVTVKPSTPALWEIKQEVAPGSSSLSMFCQRKSSLANERSVLLLHHFLLILVGQALWEHFAFV